LPLGGIALCMDRRLLFIVTTNLSATLGDPIPDALQSTFAGTVVLHSGSLLLSRSQQLHLQLVFMALPAD
jgi:hypothetical protein